MENSLWFERYILAFAKALENHSHLTMTGSRMMLFLKSGGITKSLYIYKYACHIQEILFIYIFWSPFKLLTEKTPFI